MRFFHVSVLSMTCAVALFLAACNTTEPKGDAGEPGAGDFDVAVGVFYGDTAYTPNGFFGSNGVILQSFDSLRADFSRVDTMGYMVQGGSFSHLRGDSIIDNLASSVQVIVGARPAVSGIYEVGGHWAHSGSAKAGMIGKASIYVTWLQNGGLDWSHPDSSAGGKVKVVVTADSIQAIGKNIRLKSGKVISFNLTTQKTWNP